MQKAKGDRRGESFQVILSAWRQSGLSGTEQNCWV